MPMVLFHLGQQRKTLSHVGKVALLHRRKVCIMDEEELSKDM